MSEDPRAFARPSTYAAWTALRQPVRRYSPDRCWRVVDSAMPNSWAAAMTGAGRDVGAQHVELATGRSLADGGRHHALRTVQVEMSQEFDRPPSVVFRFLVTDHIANHPRWDPQMELWPITEGPIGLGSVIGRRQSRGEVPTEGTMEVVEFEPDRSVGWLVHDGPFALRSMVSFEPIEGHRTRVTIRTELPDAVKAFDPSFMQRSLRKMKALVESET